MAVYSANTEYIICQMNCSGVTSTVATIHPTYGGLLSGDTVVEMNLVLIGGRNGLNC
jgi:hypothetical protein